MMSSIKIAIALLGIFSVSGPAGTEKFKLDLVNNTQ